MRYAGSMPELSPLEDLLRRIQETSPFDLRAGQLAAVTKISDNPNQDKFNFVLPTGYGKSVTGLASFDVLKSQGRVNRLLIVVPTGTQKEQYASDIATTASVYGLNVKTPESMEDRKKIALDGGDIGIRLHQKNMSEVFVCTIQHIQRDPGFYSDLMSTGQWLVFADEYHKLNSEAEWGKAANNLNFKVIIGMTATPIRTDGKATIFMGKSPDVEVSFEDAYKEEAIRAVIAHVEHYFVDVEENDEDGEKVVRRKLTEEIAGTKESKELRYLTKYCASILSSAHDCLQSLELRHKGQNQMLVFAVSVNHARDVSNLMNSLFGQGFSDWIGTGEFGRSDEENRNVIKRYRNGTDLKCLVQVGMATEGFDNPTSSVLVFLNAPSRRDTIANYQGAGRGVRRNFGIRNFKDDVCHMFASPDNPMAEVARLLAERTIGPFELDANSDDFDEETGKKGAPLYSIPEIKSSVVDAELDRSVIIQNIPKADVEETMSEFVKKQGYSSTNVDVETAKSLILEILADKEIARREEAIRQVEEEANSAENWQARVKGATAVLVGNVTRLRYGASHPKTAPGDVAKQLNSHWVKHTGKRHGEMTSEEFKFKYEWLKRINDELVNRREIPSWVTL